MITKLQYNLTLKSLQIASKICLEAYNQNYRITLHSGLADPGLWPGINAKGQVKGQLAIQLYYLCRASDTAGSGWADIDVTAAAAVLETSIYSIRRRIRWGFQHGLFTAKLRRSPGVFRIYYSSLVKVAARLGLSDLGAISSITVFDLPKIKFKATEAQALQLQKRSRYNQTRKNRQRKTADPEMLVRSEICNGPILTRYGRLSFLKRSYAPYGGSQTRLAWEMNRHTSTVQRRLSDGYRQKHGLEPVEKTQLAVSPNYTTQVLTSGRPPIRKLDRGQRLIKIPRLGTFRITNNVYSIPDTLQPKRNLRAKVKRAIRAAELAKETEWKLDPLHQANKTTLIECKLQRYQAYKASLSIETSRPAECDRETTACNQTVLNHLEVDSISKSNQLKTGGTL